MLRRTGAIIMMSLTCEKNFTYLHTIQSYIPYMWFQCMSHSLTSGGSTTRVLAGVTSYYTIILPQSMENPVQDISDVVHRLTQGSPKVQEETINQYFTHNASFTHPFCRTGSYDGSRRLIHAIFRWYKIMSPKIDLGINSIGILLKFDYFIKPPLTQCCSLRRHKPDTLREHQSSLLHLGCSISPSSG